MDYYTITEIFAEKPHLASLLDLAFGFAWVTSADDNLSQLNGDK